MHIESVFNTPPPTRSDKNMQQVAWQNSIATKVLCWGELWASWCDWEEIVLQLEELSIEKWKDTLENDEASME
eukprot:6475283-Amphidinium_carterae.1